MSNIDTSTNTNENFSKTTFANITESNQSEITALERKLKEEIGENVVLIAYQI